MARGVPPNLNEQIILKVQYAGPNPFYGEKSLSVEKGKTFSLHSFL